MFILNLIAPLSNFYTDLCVCLSIGYMQRHLNFRKAMEFSHIFKLTLIVQIILSFVSGETTSSLFVSFGSSVVTKQVVPSKVNGSSTMTTPVPEKTTPTLKSSGTSAAATISSGSTFDPTGQSTMSVVESTSLSSSTETQSSSTTTMPLASSVPSQCGIGYFSCKDGRCEPFESLCGAIGAVTTASTSTLARSTMSLTSGTVTPMVTGQSSSSSLYASSTPATPNANSTPIRPTPTTPELTTTLGGPVPGPEVCLPGWEDCKDGSCEPFHWLCIEHQSQAIIGR